MVQFPVHISLRWNLLGSAHTQHIAASFSTLRVNVKTKDGENRSMGSVNYSTGFLNTPSHGGSVDMKCQQKQAKILQSPMDML